MSEITTPKTPIAPPAPGSLSIEEQTALRDQALKSIRSCAYLGNKRSTTSKSIYLKESRRLAKLQRTLYVLKTPEPSDDLKWLYDNIRLVRSDLQDLQESSKTLSRLPVCRTASDEAIPRCVVLARALLTACQYKLSEPVFSFFIRSVQEVEPLRLNELGGMIPALKLSLLVLLADRGWKAYHAFRKDGVNAPTFDVGHLITSLRFIGEIDWKDVLEELSALDRILRLDPSRVYHRMDFESRESYRKTVARLAAHSDMNEVEVAELAVKLASNPPIEPDAPEPLRARLQHVGYYLIDRRGAEELQRQIGYRKPFYTRFQDLFRDYPDESYIIGIEFLSLITVAALIMSIVQHHDAGGLILGALLLVLPATQAAVEVMNYLVTAVLTPLPLPKLDFSESVDAGCATMVAIPTLLINEKQIRQLVDDIEIRYLVNRDPNIHYALLTDLPDSAEPAEERDARTDLAIKLIGGLNERYGKEPYGRFYLFHRHRVYNPREGAWMGFERKRGKLLDLNQYLRGAFDPFPVKAGDLKHLPVIRYVLTLDSDTQLPRGSAQRMIGTMAHPLNRPLIDPELNIVTEGYGILQPRVGISVQSASRSRLASIYSGQTGFDIYSRAVSDVYQDLYGEGIFTGKGIYDVDALRQVLEHRFPRNALLSHDLIEGAYTRAGLASDIEVIDDYPSHYSAYNRRKHRWLRGDWQIVQWIFPKVPDETRRMVENPISLASRWKILDNLRRSLVEPGTFLLLVAGWFVLPAGARFWTVVTLALLFLPIYFRLAFSLVAVVFTRRWHSTADLFVDFFTSHLSILLNIAFLAHQALVSLDAIVRTIIRSTITHSRLLEWETATEAELGIRKRTPVDVYLDWIPVLALLLAAALFWKPESAPWALPFIVAWALSPFISKWLNRSPHTEEQELGKSDRLFLRDLALRTWRYYADFSNEKNHWLIPDNVQEEPYRVAERISPTNLGFLLNARQAAVEFGYLTVTEFARETDSTMQTVLKLPREFGHFLNWYDNLSLQPLEPRFVSSVDSGNLAASLWTLKQGCLGLISGQIIRKNALEGVYDHHRSAVAAGASGVPLIKLAAAKAKEVGDWLPQILLHAESAAARAQTSAANERERSEAANRARLAALREEARLYMPWLLPEYAAIRALPPAQLQLPETAPVLETTESYYSDLDRKLQTLTTAIDTSSHLLPLIEQLRKELPSAKGRVLALGARLHALAELASRLVHEMDFGAVSDKRRKLLSIGYDVTGGQMSKSCYDLLASEARIATFIAVAKGDAPQENWFRLGRQHTQCENQNVLVSWTGTMFEYLMAVIWMKSHPDTLLDRAVSSAVRAQQSYATARRVPWGISEAAFSQRDAEGIYQYAAFGVPGLALSVARAGTLVISPYSSCLALMIDPTTAVENLRLMAKKKWLSAYGFYESADYTASKTRRFMPRHYELVRCWMAHHQGMSLTALANVFHENVFQRWFHAEPLVQASELILQERPLRVRASTDSGPRKVLSFITRGGEPAPEQVAEASA